MPHADLRIPIEPKSDLGHDVTFSAHIGWVSGGLAMDGLMLSVIVYASFLALERELGTALKHWA